MAKKFRRSSRARFTKRVKRSRAGAVTKARDRHIMKVARKVVKSSRELKYTPFIQQNTGSNLLATSQYCYIQDVFGGSTAVFPAQGDGVHTRDGDKYRLEGFNIFFGLRASYWNMQVPVDVYIVKCPSRVAVANGDAYTKDVWPQCVTTDATTWVSAPTIVGKMEPSYGKVIKKMTIQPRIRYANSAAFYDKAVDVDSAMAQGGQIYHAFIKINKTIQCDTTTAEIPKQLDKYAVIFHSRNYEYGTGLGSVSGTSWVQQYFYTQAVFRDV